KRTASLPSKTVTKKPACSGRTTVDREPSADIPQPTLPPDAPENNRAIHDAEEKGTAAEKPRSAPAPKPEFGAGLADWIQRIKTRATRGKGSGTRSAIVHSRNSPVQ